MVDPIAQQLACKGKNTNKVIIYCRRLDEVADVYEEFKYLLGERMTQPFGAPAYIQKYRMVDMYTSCIECELKFKIVQSFVDPGSTLRDVVASTAFGMGLECECVREVIHLGPSQDIDHYVQ